MLNNHQILTKIYHTLYTVVHTFFNVLVSIFSKIEEIDCYLKNHKINLNNIVEIMLVEDNHVNTDNQNIYEEKIEILFVILNKILDCILVDIDQPIIIIYIHLYLKDINLIEVKIYTNTFFFFDLV